MYIETVPNRNSRPAILLREGWREGQRVRKRTLANLTHWPPAKIDQLRRVLKDQPLIDPDHAFVIERSLPHGHVELVLEALRRLKLPALLDAKPSRERNLVLAMLVERLIHPASKLATARLWHTTTLAEELSLGEADEDDLYHAMDWLLARQTPIENQLAQRHLSDGAQVLYDVSSSYYEGVWDTSIWGSPPQCFDFALGIVAEDHCPVFPCAPPCRDKLSPAPLHSSIRILYNSSEFDHLAQV